MGALELCPIFEDSEDPWADSDPWLKTPPPRDSVDERIRKLKESLKAQTLDSPPGLNGMPSPTASESAKSHRKVVDPSNAPGGAPAASKSLADRIKALMTSLENNYEESNHDHRHEKNNNQNNDNFNNKSNHHYQSSGNDQTDRFYHNNHNNN